MPFKKKKKTEQKEAREKMCVCVCGREKLKEFHLLSA